jgi:hypothetical protein
MDNNKDIPYIAYEAAMSRFERMNKRLWIVVILLIVLLVGSNIAWLIYESQYEYYETTVTQENTDGYNNYIGNDGDITNGQTDSND